MLNLFYTSDLHGRIVSHHDILNKNISVGLSRLSTFFSQQDIPYLYLDNGDILQGAAIMDQSRQEKRNPAADALNMLGCQYYTLGNHDFNYGLSYLNEYISQMNATLLLANVRQDQKPFGAEYSIVEKEGIRIGLIGVTTAYIPQWEVPEHINGLTFVSAAKTVQRIVPLIRSSVDVVIVLYHGGIEQDLQTKKPIGRPTIENEAVAISSIEGVDFVLSGHQHMLIHSDKILQPGVEGAYIGALRIEKSEEGIQLFPSLIANDHVIDSSFEEHFSSLQRRTETWLDKPVGHTSQDFRSSSPLALRSGAHPLVTWIHQLQLEQTQADISVVSLPNDVQGFHGTITNRDLLNAFVYPNTLFVVEMLGEEIKKAMEQSAAYFSLKDGNLVVSDSFLSPKVEHYNYDMYAGMKYTIDITKPVGQRITHITIDGKPFDENSYYQVVVNNYRANGGGDYSMFQEAKVIQEFDVTLLQLSTNALTKKPELTVEVTPAFELVTQAAGLPSP